jgi:hypothetical protein
VRVAVAVRGACREVRSGRGQVRSGRREVRLRYAVAVAVAAL